MTEQTKTWYRPGLVFYSRISAYQVVCRPYLALLTPRGDKYDEIRELLAEFGIHNGEYSYQTADGFTETAADIRGHFFDLDAQAEQKGWTDEEKEIVARTMLREVITKHPGDCQLYSAATLPKPWPKYDDTHHNQIPVLADQLGLVAEALAYERQNKKRASVIEKLTELSSSATETEAAEPDELVAA